jgi:hypothetical protein
MSEKIWDADSLINEDAIDALTDEQVVDVLAILTKAGY